MGPRATWNDEVADGPAELTDHYLSVGPAQRLVILEAARLARYGARRR